MKRPKKVVSYTPVDTKKEVKVSKCSTCIEWESQKPSWNFSMMDRDGQWSWKNVSYGKWIEIVNKLQEFENLSWTQIKEKGSHQIEVYKIVKEARQRLTLLNQDDTDFVFSLRLTGKNRIFGILRSNVLNFVWWDPNHEICPSK